MSTPLAKSLATEEEKLLACIHCGLCLEACPTYVITGDENDGPRGRLYLMRAVGEERLPNTATSFERHIDRCLGCRACEQVCPAGVEYGQLLEAARGELFTAATGRGFQYQALRFALRHVWSHPARLRIAFVAARLIRDSRFASVLVKTGIARLISHRVEFGLALLESSAKRKSTKKEIVPNKIRAKHAAGEPVMLFDGCVGEGLFARVNRATTRVLAVNGFEVESPPEQVCCGALHAHAGDLEGARVLARRNIKAFSNTTGVPVVTNAGGCGAMLTGYGHLLADDQSFAAEASKFSARVRDISQQLATVKIKPGAALADGPITYDASCHLLYGQRAGEAPLEMLGATGKLNFARLEGSERCCGGAGIYNLLEPDLSRRVLAEKLQHVENSRAKVLATGNPGCQMQIGAGANLAGMELQVCHTVELLDESYEQAGFYADYGE